jgi:cellulose synthase (UDP-forming)
MGGVGIEMRVADALKDGDKVSLLLKRGQQEYSFPCVVTRAFGSKVGIRMVFHDHPRTH